MAYVLMIKTVCWGAFGYGVLFSNSFSVCLTKCVKYTMQLYDINKEPVDTSAELKGIEEEVKANWKKRYTSRTTVVISRGNDIVHRGYGLLKHDSVIGFPQTFNYKSVEDVPDWSSLLKTSYNIDDVYSEAVENLKNSLILSDKAKKFVLARYMYLAQSHYSFNSTNLFLSVWLFFYINFYYFKKTFFWTSKLRTSKFKLGFRLVTSAAVTFVMFQTYWFLQGKYTKSVDRWTDNKAMTLSKEYAEGGIEFYDKLIQRNTTLRTLSNSMNSGRKLYTTEGDLRNRICLYPYIPLSERRQNIEKYLTELNS